MRVHSRSVLRYIVLIIDLCQPCLKLDWIPCYSAHSELSVGISGDLRIYDGWKIVPRGVRPGQTNDSCR